MTVSVKKGRGEDEDMSTNRADFVYIDLDDSARAWVALSLWDVLVVLLGAVLVNSA